MKGIALTKFVDNLAMKYGSISNIPESKLKPLQQDFQSDHEPIRHHFFDEEELPWNTTLETTRLRNYIVAKSLRIDSHPKRLALIHKYGISQGIAYNIVYQYHLHHRGYTYQYKNEKPLLVSYRKEILDAIHVEKIPGPQSETGLADVMKTGGDYRPTGKTIGKIRKVIILRGVTYQPKHNHDRSKIHSVKGVLIPDTRNKKSR